MVNTIQYTGNLVPIELSNRPLDGITDLWLRKNPRTEIDPDGNTIQLADEAYMNITTKGAPAQAEVQENFEEWYERACEWTENESADESEILTRLEEAEAKNAELTSIIYTLMGVQIDD